MKRLRKSVEPRRIKYYGCGEYGELNKRPHYHAILFGIHAIKDRQLIENAWPCGFVYCGSVTYESARYVADYTSKQGGEEWQERMREDMAWLGRELDNLEIPFNIQSMGIGKQYALDNAEQFEQTLRLYVKGQPVSIPRYYLKVLSIDPELIHKEARRRKGAEADEDMRNGITGIRRRIAQWDRAAQRERNTKAQISRTRKGRL